MFPLSILFFLKIPYFDNEKRLARQLICFITFSNFVFVFPFVSDRETNLETSYSTSSLIDVIKLNILQYC